MDPELVFKETVPLKSVTVLPNASLAVIVMSKAVPVTAETGVLRTKWFTGAELTFKDVV
jgi:hypothetical protein